MVEACLLHERLAPFVLPIRPPRRVEFYQKPIEGGYPPLLESVYIRGHYRSHRAEGVSRTYVS